MKLDINSYRNKVLGCWNGKNIGGTLGAPYECTRGVFDISYYTQELNGQPLPNDDLDLQLVWLNAVEKYGRAINASILGEYWLSFIIPDWSEYGAGKNNLKAGIVPPLSGYMNNPHRDSNGSFILSEIWACLTPGYPEIAARYAYEDSIVNHSHEGLYAEVFCAAVESAAFVESDPYTLIEIGLSYIPNDCAVTKGINCVIESYKAGLSWKEARKVLMKEVPGSFGSTGREYDALADDDPIGDMGFDAPSNIGIIIIGWLYGEGDFGNSICIATGCGEDADCTAGTLGAILGIIQGNDMIEEKWLTPLGGNIKTFCVDLTKWLNFSVPNTTEQLTQRILKLTPLFLGSEICDYLTAERGYDILIDNQNLKNHSTRLNSWYQTNYLDVLKRSPFVVKYDSVLFNVLIDYKEEPFIQEGEPKSFKISFENNFPYQQWLDIKWHLPEGWEITPASNQLINLYQQCNIPHVEAEITIIPRNIKSAKHEILVQISSVGHHSQELFPIVLFTGGC